jgi:acetyltransferase-like isoleucine patch superfamily enzyme
LIRPNTVVYENVEIGKNFECGHNVMIRENTVIGDNTRIGTNTVIEGDVEIGSNVNIQSCVYIPKHTKIYDDVFIGPCVVITNDKYPPHAIGGLVGAVIENNVAIGANATVLPGVTISEYSLVAAGAIVARDVPPYSMAIGVPAKNVDLPKCIKDKVT